MSLASSSHNWRLQSCLQTPHCYPAHTAKFETCLAFRSFADMLQGKAEGGSGVPLDKDTYEESVAFWDTHAAILVGQKPSGE